MWIITPKPPYDFAKTLRGARFLYVMGREHAGTFRRVIRAGSGLALLEVAGIGTVEQPRIQARVLATSGHVDESALIAKARRIVNADSDLTPFYAYAKNNPALGTLIEPLYGLHTFQADTLFEAVALTVIEQQITLKMAQTSERWLLAWANESIHYDGVTYYTFPDPLMLAACSVDDLIPMKITGIRIRVILDIAKQIAAGALDLEALRDQPRAVVYPALMSLRGIGHWTAAWAITRALGDYMLVGRADVALRAAVNHYFYGLTGRCEPETLETTFNAYGDFAGVAGYYTLTRWAFDRYAHLI
ncbi:MAG: DNA-3-methyladenine glycosylase 2 family protein [Anaerolinea sp.]|nr:DNA-3-methyladenine glycosylase 2 family protein [Anaerolinea sp.]